MAKQPVKIIDSEDSNLWKIEEFIRLGVSNKFYYTQGSDRSHKFYICNQAGNKDIFYFSQGGFEIELVLGVEDFLRSSTTSTAINNSVKFEIKVGKLDLVQRTEVISDQKIILKFYYQPSAVVFKEQDSRKMWLRRLGPGSLRLYSSKVTEVKYVYGQLNNSLHNFSKTTTFGMTFSTDLVIKKSLGGKYGDEISLKFGNGTFKSGIWKLGVWNDGWRGTWNETDKIYYFFESVDQFNTYELNPNQWLLKLIANNTVENMTAILNNVKVDDFVTVGNVVGIDINEGRYLLKDYYRVVSNPLLIIIIWNKL